LGACTQLWDINEEAPAELLGSQSLIAGSDIAPICSEVAPALAHLAAALTEGGFLLLREFTGPHALLLQALMDGSSPPRCVQQMSFCGVPGRVQGTKGWPDPWAPLAAPASACDLQGCSVTPSCVGMLHAGLHGSSPC
jgi:hypothetical protein